MRTVTVHRSTSRKIKSSYLYKGPYTVSAIHDALKKSGYFNNRVRKKNLTSWDWGANMVMKMKSM